MQGAANEYFQLLDQLRQLNRSSSLTDDCIRLVDVADRCIDSHSTIDAQTVLGGLKQCLQQLRPILDYDERTHREAMEVMGFKKEILELKIELAIIQRNEELAERLRHALADMDPFFASAISDLDPDRT